MPIEEFWSWRPQTQKCSVPWAKLKAGNVLTFLVSGLTVSIDGLTGAINELVDVVNGLIGAFNGTGAVLGFSGVDN